MDESMDGFMLACIYGWMDGKMDGWIDGWMVGCRDGWINGWTHASMHGWMDACMDRGIGVRLHVTFAHDIKCTLEHMCAHINMCIMGTCLISSMHKRRVLYPLLHRRRQFRQMLNGPNSARSGQS